MIKRLRICIRHHIFKHYILVSISISNKWLKVNSSYLTTWKFLFLWFWSCFRYLFCHVFSGFLMLGLTSLSQCLSFWLSLDIVNNLQTHIHATHALLKLCFGLFLVNYRHICRWHVIREITHAIIGMDWKLFTCYLCDILFLHFNRLW